MVLTTSPPDTSLTPYCSYLPLIQLRGNEQNSLCKDALSGLTNENKFLLPKYLYDKRGSELFEQITELPEYYLTRAEQEILDRHAYEIIENLQRDCWLVELGAGSGKKTRRLLQALEHRSSVETTDVPGSASRYIPIDISEEFLRESSLLLQAEFPKIPIQPICADFLQGVEYIAAERTITKSAAQLVVYFPGSTIGNLTREEAVSFFVRLRQLLRKGDMFLLAADMCASEKKSIQTLHAAYNDAGGVTADFNRNILHRLCSELSTHIPIHHYKHIAFYNAAALRMELYLESIEYNTFVIDGQHISLAAGERIHTEYSHKFDDVMLTNLAIHTGFTLETSWKDAQQYFSIYLFVAANSASV